MFNDRVYNYRQSPVLARKNLLSLSNVSSSSNEKLNTSFNRGKDGIFRPASIYSVATEIDFGSSNRILKSSNSRYSSSLSSSHYRDNSLGRSGLYREQSFTLSPNSNRLWTRPDDSSRNYYSNFNENLSHLKNRSHLNGNYSRTTAFTPNQSSYRFTNAYYTPKVRDRPLLSNLNLKFSSRVSSTSPHSSNHLNENHRGSTSSNKASSVSSNNSSARNSVSSTDGSTTYPRPALERNKFLIKFREHNFAKNSDQVRRPSVSWDIPVEPSKSLQSPFTTTNSNIDQKPPSVVGKVNETEQQTFVVNDLSSNPQAENDQMMIGDKPNDSGQNKNLTRWKGSFALNLDRDEIKPELSKSGKSLPREPKLEKEQIEKNFSIEKVHFSLNETVERLSPLESKQIEKIKKSKKKKVKDGPIPEEPKKVLVLPEGAEKTILEKPILNQLPKPKPIGKELKLNEILQNDGKSQQLAEANKQCYGQLKRLTVPAKTTDQLVVNQLDLPLAVGISKSSSSSVKKDDGDEINSLQPSSKSSKSVSSKILKNINPVNREALEKIQLEVSATTNNRTRSSIQKELDVPEKTSTSDLDMKKEENSLAKKEKLNALSLPQTKELDEPEKASSSDLKKEKLNVPSPSNIKTQCRSLTKELEVPEKTSTSDRDVKKDKLKILSSLQTKEMEVPKKTSTSDLDVKKDKLEVESPSITKTECRSLTKELKEVPKKTITSNLKENVKKEKDSLVKNREKLKVPSNTKVQTRSLTKELEVSEKTLEFELDLKTSLSGKKLNVPSSNTKIRSLTNLELPKVCGSKQHLDDVSMMKKNNQIALNLERAELESSSQQPRSVTKDLGRILSNDLSQDCQANEKPVNNNDQMIEKSKVKKKLKILEIPPLSMPTKAVVSLASECSSAKNLSTKQNRLKRSCSNDDNGGGGEKLLKSTPSGLTSPTPSASLSNEKSSIVLPTSSEALGNSSENLNGGMAVRLEKTEPASLSPKSPRSPTFFPSSNSPLMVKPKFLKNEEDNKEEPKKNETGHNKTGGDKQCSLLVIQKSNLIRSLSETTSSDNKEIKAIKLDAPKLSKASKTLKSLTTTTTTPKSPKCPVKIEISLTNDDEKNDGAAKMPKMVVVESKKQPKKTKVKKQKSLAPKMIVAKVEPVLLPLLIVAKVSPVILLKPTTTTKPIQIKKKKEKPMKITSEKKCKNDGNGGGGVEKAKKKKAKKAATQNELTIIESSAVKCESLAKIKNSPLIKPSTSSNVSGHSASLTCVVEQEKHQQPALVDGVKSPVSPPAKAIKFVDPFQKRNHHQKKIRFREYSIEDFNFLSVLGRGSFGKVMLAELNNYDGCYFAIKCLKKHTVIEDDDVESIMIERKVLAYGTSHPFICKLFCTFQTKSHLFFAMELCSGGDLMFHVQKEGKFTESKARFYAAEMLCALWFLHKRSIIYRDLKLDNVMIANDGHIRLVDFGMCVGKMYREEMLPSNFCGTVEYMAPEIIKGVKYNHSVDYWAFGVVIYEMCVGTSPFQGTDEDELMWNVCNTEVHYPRFLSENVKSLLELLLKKNPQERLGLPTSPYGDVVSQAWLHGVQWDQVEKCKEKPPFIPQLSHDTDVSYFDRYFTKETPGITPTNKTIEENEQQLFQGFNYTNHRMTD